MKRFALLAIFPFYIIGLVAQTRSVDICIYGASSAGVIAAYTAKKAGKTVLLIEPGRHLGGLTSGGLGYTDIGNKFVISGIARDYYRRIGAHYGKFEQWIFEPHVARQTFEAYINAAGVEVWYDHYLVHAHNESGTLKAIRIRNLTNNEESVVQAKMFIDCTYEGDLMAKAGVSYIVGREDNALYHETYNGVQLRDKHQFPDGVDPYVVPGKPETGLLWGISREPMAPQGSGDKKVQAYNYRLCLTNRPENRIPIERPDDYDSTQYELLLRTIDKNRDLPLGTYLKIDLMPNGKTDINNNGPFSTDMIGMNYNYPELDYAGRKRIADAHERYIRGLLYFLGHDPRLPEHIRKDMLQWGYPKDEYVDNNHWSPQMYVREARRMKGAYVMTQANCEGKQVVEDAVGMAAYTMDSHNCQRIVINGMVKNEGDVQVGGFGPYPISYRSLIPQAEECKNLLVPVCLSASHIAYGSIRMEPVFMVLAQSAALAAVQAIDTKKSVQQVNVKHLQELLKSNPLMDSSTPEILVDNDDAVNVKTKGNWERQKRGAYGASLFIAEQAGQDQSVRFVPTVQQKGAYEVYFYLPKISGLAATIRLNIFDGSSVQAKSIVTSEIKVEGQTSGEWVNLGRYELPAGKKAYIEVQGANETGSAVADAVLLMPVK